jgi:hypothetical protein
LTHIEVEREKTEERLVIASMRPVAGIETITCTESMGDLLQNSTRVEIVLNAWL